MATKINPNSVEVKYSVIGGIPREWGTPQQRENLLKSLKSWAAGDGCVRVEISELGMPLVYEFKEKEVLRVFFLIHTGGGAWEYSLTERGLCKNHGQRVLGPNIEPPLLYPWADFEKGILPKPGKKPQGALPKPEEEQRLPESHFPAPQP